MPRLASASGEEWARRAMPTRSGAGPGGSRASGPLSRGVGTSGNKVGVVSLLRARATFLRKGRLSEAEGSVVAVAIARLAKHGGSISLFVRHVKDYIRILFALGGRIFSLNRIGTGQVTLATFAATVPQVTEHLEPILEDRLGAGFGQDRHIDH